MIEHTWDPVQNKRYLPDNLYTGPTNFYIGITCFLTLYEYDAPRVSCNTQPTYIYIYIFPVESIYGVIVDTLAPEGMLFISEQALGAQNVLKYKGCVHVNYSSIANYYDGMWHVINTFLTTINDSNDREQNFDMGRTTVKHPISNALNPEI